MGNNKVQMEVNYSWYADSFRKHEYLIRFHIIILPHWNNTGSWNLSTWKARANLTMSTLQTNISYIVNTMAVDDLATQGARASTAMPLTYRACPECFNHPTVSVNMHNTPSYAFLTPFATRYYVHGQCSITIITAIHSSHKYPDTTNLNTWWLIPMRAHYIVMPQMGSCMLGGFTAWASCQIRKIAGAHAPGMPGTFSPSPQVSDPDMHHGTCVTHVPWCMPGSLTSSFLWNRRRGKTFPAFPAHAQPAILRIW